MPTHLGEYKLNLFDLGIIQDEYVSRGMYGFVSWKWVDPLAKWIGARKCLEVMSGRGILASALLQRGVDLVATDDFSWAARGHALLPVGNIHTSAG